MHLAPAHLGRADSRRFTTRKAKPILDAQIVRNAADLIEKHGSNVWFEKSAAELWALVKPANWTGAEAVAKSNDTLDVWIDSGSSSRAVLMRRTELSSIPQSATPQSALDWQADVYLEGSDQHRGWFQSSLLLSLAGNGAAPFKTVLTHGFMVDADREKISKASKAGRLTKNRRPPKPTSKNTARTSCGCGSPRRIIATTSS